MGRHFMDFWSDLPHLLSSFLLQFPLLPPSFSSSFLSSSSLPFPPLPFLLENINGDDISPAGLGATVAIEAVAVEVSPKTRSGSLGHQVKDMKIMSLEQIYLFSLPVKESEITGFSLAQRR